jgi:hypothetical protein
MLDNGYLYLAATHLSLYRMAADWAMVIEVFGYSPRSGLPDTQIYTFASALRDRDLPENYKDRQAYENYLKYNPHNESRFAFPIGEGNCKDAENDEFIAEDATEILVCDRSLRLPLSEEYGLHGIKLEKTPRVHISELCRFIADVERENVLATSEEQRIGVLPGMRQLEEWNHPNIVEDSLPSYNRKCNPEKIAARRARTQAPIRYCFEGATPALRSEYK